jgi:hypothetical protein
MFAFRRSFVVAAHGRRAKHQLNNGAKKHYQRAIIPDGGPD